MGAIAGGPAREMVARLEQLAAVAPLPAIRALRLPPPEAAGDKDGEFCAVELAGGTMGMSYVLLDDTLRQLAGMDSGSLAGADALAVARWFASERGARRTVGFAAGNALCRWFFDRAGFRPDATVDSIGLLAPRAGDRIGMIGFFGRLVDRIIATGADLTVVELRADLIARHPGYRISLDPMALRGCTKVLSTSSVLLNDTLEPMLAACAGAEYFAMVGPGAGCLPDPLFERGVTLLGGTWVVEADAFRAALLAGRSWSAHTGKFALRRQDYPGFDALLARLR